MKISPRAVALVAAVLGAAVAAGVAYGDESQPRPERAGVGRLFRVDQQFSQQTENGCRYDATVRGTVREIIVSRAGNDGTRYVPHLDVNARLLCNEGSGSHRSHEITPSPDYSRAELEHELGLRANVMSSRDGQVCTVRPALTFRDGRFALGGVRGGCDVPRGGGPHDGRLPVRQRGEATSGHSFRMVTRDGRDVIEYVDFGGH